jgi:hypothetical protein
VPGKREENSMNFVEFLLEDFESANMIVTSEYSVDANGPYEVKTEQINEFATKVELMSEHCFLIQLKKVSVFDDSVANISRSTVVYEIDHHGKKRIVGNSCEMNRNYKIN